MAIKLKSDDFIPLYVNEPYADGLKPLPPKEGQKRPEPAFVQPAAFKPSHPMKESVGLGDYFGIIGPPPEYQADPVKDKELKKGSITFKQPNVKTNPPVKGTYGMYGQTLSERQVRTLTHPDPSYPNPHPPP